jgi:predicted phosphodiesterase
MRVAALNDIHGNLPALQAVLTEVEASGADRIVLGGDIAAGPMPAEVLDLVFSLGDRVLALHGNADRALVQAFDGEAADPTIRESAWRSVTWAAHKLSREHRDWLAALPPTVTLQADGVGEVLFCHATPRNDVEVFTAASPEERVVPMFAGVSSAAVVCGHTHMQLDRRVGPVRVLNAGSVGTPYGESGAHWLLLGPGVNVRRTGYDLEAAAVRIRATGFPAREDFAANVLRPPDAAEVTAMMERAAQRG